jgi:hypothetical protein
MDEMALLAQKLFQMHNLSIPISLVLSPHTPSHAPTHILSHVHPLSSASGRARLLSNRCWGSILGSKPGKRPPSLCSQHMQEGSSNQPVT